MPDRDTPEPSTPEPVLVGYVVTVILGAAAAFGVDVADDTVGRVASAVAGLLVVAFTAWVTRSKVTPTVKADAAVVEARAEEVAAARDAILAAAQPPTPSFGEFGGGGQVNTPGKLYERVAPPAPPAPAPWAPTRQPPPAGLD